MKRLPRVPWLVLALAALPASAQDGPPREDRALRPPDLVELATSDSAIRLDVRYAYPVMGIPFGSLTQPVPAALSR